MWVDIKISDWYYDIISANEISVHLSTVESDFKNVIVNCNDTYTYTTLLIFLVNSNVSFWWSHKYPWVTSAPAAAQCESG